MLFTLVYAYLSYVLLWKEKRRRMKYFRLIRNVSRHSSISALKLGNDSHVTEGRSPVFQSSGNTDALQLVQDSGGKILVTPKSTVDLKGWTLYLGVSPEMTTPVGTQFVLFEATSQQGLHPSDIPVLKVTDYGIPLAWKSGPPFKFLMQCNLESLVTLVMGMIDRRLTAEDNLDINSLSTVQVKGHADRLIQTHPSSAVWRSGSSQLTPADLQDSGSICSSNESLASVGKEIGLDHDLSRFSPSIDINVDAMSNGLECVDINLDGGEAMAEFSETHTEVNAAGDLFNLSDEEEIMTENGHGEVKITDKSKPPNVLIYCGKKDSSRKFEGVRQIFKNCLYTERYVIYLLKHDQIHTTPWKDNCALLILASEKLYDSVDTAVLDYFKNGGRIISFCSTLDQFILKREQYQDPLMNIIQLDCGEKKNVTVIGGRYCYETIDGKLTTIESFGDTDVLGETDDKPVVVKVKSKSGTGDDRKPGQVVLSQVYLDKDPGEMGISTKIFTMLKESNSDKFDILSYLLEELGMDCSRRTIPKLTPGIFMAKEKEKIPLLMEALSGRIKSGIIRTPKKTLQFMESTASPEPPTEDTLPVFTELSRRRTKYFQAEVFFKHLSTKSLGQVILYTDVVPTTMTLLDGLMFSVPSDIDVVAIAGRQTNGRGRGGNAWISPLGCAMFTAHIRLDQHSLLGQKSVFLQHITAVAVVHSVRKILQYQDLDLRVKWPNDIYFGKSMKLGGVIISSTLTNGKIHALIGCGFNVSNSNPTICINDIIQQYNMENETTLSTFSTEELLGRVITTMESLISDFQQNGSDSFCELYYKYWLHSGTRVRLESEGGTEVTIQGLDENGYLQVLTKEGETISLQPDGNTFDMLRNLITIKTR